MSARTEIDETGRAAIAESLSRLLADTYTLYLKTQNYHWNVEGPQFHALHTMFEEQYVELRDAVDRIAERIRALGFPAPGSYAEYSKLTSIEEAEPGIADSIDMVRALAAGHETLAGSARATVDVSEEAGDVATADLATNRVEVHEKTAWMLGAMAA
jgi:starvation-inducible DNA-binding protein